MVGAIADLRLAGTPAGDEVTKILDGMSLARAAVLPDQIKGWDKAPPDSPKAFHLKEFPEIEKQLIAFWKANPVPSSPVTDEGATDPPSHHWFHYADIPVQGDETYENGKAGRSRWDIVHMLKYCVQVLRGEESEDNPRGITKAVAIILLTHYVGDIHQPLHVGAEYFGKDGKPVNPDDGGESFPDQGGNSLFLMLEGGGKHTTLHGFWDSQSVMAAFDKVSKEMKAKDPALTGYVPTQAIAQYLAAQEPAGWQFPSSMQIEDAGLFMADDILPLARQAHERLTFVDVAPKEDRGQTLASGFAREKDMPDGVRYLDWAAATVALELDKAGWRLAEILKQSLTPALASDATATSAPKASASPEASPAPTAGAEPSLSASPAN